MQEDLQGLARELRKETCPRRVLDEALMRIAAETPPRSRLRYALAMALVGCLFLCGLLAKWQVAQNNARRHAEFAVQQAQSRTQTARQAETALALIGAVLRDTGAHSESIISDAAIPPLRNGLQTAKNKIIRNTEL